MGPRNDMDEGPLRIGDEYLGRYPILAVLGRGGFGWVYRSVDKYLGREVALKVSYRLSEHRERHEELRARAQQEAQLLWELRHPNLVEMFEGSLDPEGRFYIVMEYLKGHTLQAVLERHGRLTIGEMMEWIVPITQAIEVAHRKNIVHRDLKPANIIVTFEGVPKIIDLGIAKVQGSWHTAYNTVLGTSGFVSPEQLNGRSVSPRSDIYALGVMMFSMLYGEHPLLVDVERMPTPREMAFLTHSKVPPFLHEVLPSFPENLSRLIWSQLSKQTGQRCESAGRLGAQLVYCARELHRHGSKALRMRKNLLDFDPEDAEASARRFPLVGFSDEGFVTQRDGADPHVLPASATRSDDRAPSGHAPVQAERRPRALPGRAGARPRYVVHDLAPPAAEPSSPGQRRRWLAALGYLRHREMQLTIALALVVGLGATTLLPSPSDARGDESESVESTPGEEPHHARAPQPESTSAVTAPGAPPQPPAAAPKPAMDEPRTEVAPASEVVAGDPPPAQPATAPPAPRRAPVAKKPKDPLGMDAMLQMVEEDLRKNAEQSRAKGPTTPLFEPKD